MGESPRIINGMKTNEMTAEMICNEIFGCGIETLNQGLSDVMHIIIDTAAEYGLNVTIDDINYNGENDSWVITPYEDNSGFECVRGEWYGVNINQRTYDFMKQDIESGMFAEIAEKLDNYFSE